MFSPGAHIGDCARKNGPRSAGSVSPPPTELLISVTRVDRPRRSERRIISFFCAPEALPTRSRKSSPVSSSSSVGRASRANACRCFTRLARISRSRGSGVRDIALRTIPVTESASLTTPWGKGCVTEGLKRNEARTLHLGRRVHLSGGLHGRGHHGHVERRHGTLDGEGR